MLRTKLFFLFICISFFVQGQEKVIDPNFNNMLQSLLKHSVTEVTPNECDFSETIFLDAREKEEFEVSHIPNAHWVGYDTFKLKNVNTIPKDSNIIVYCTVGYRSEKISEKLIKAGFTNVSNLYGGIFEWMHTGNNVVNDSITKNVHTYNEEWSQWLSNGIGNKIY